MSLFFLHPAGRLVPAFDAHRRENVSAEQKRHREIRVQNTVQNLPRGRFLPARDVKEFFGQPGPTPKRPFWLFGDGAVTHLIDNIGENL
jgi:hypothetical protein